MVTGAVIGAAVSNPALALPAAFLSHFVLDVLPHYGIDDHKGRKFLYLLVLDAAIASAFLLALFFLQPDNWPVLMLCGILGASPDLGWLPYWVQELKGKTIKYDPVSDFLVRIQWCERPWGAYVEIAWLLVMLYLFFYLIA